MALTNCRPASSGDAGRLFAPVILFGVISFSDHIWTILDPRNTVTAPLLVLFVAPQQ